ncbi:MAG TPA: hypothetical protein VFQ07_05105 [Candidatus Polarisedimenticolia bacterium]|nr:hypothetical protein [Candidatus Polarisedimenticolia bacterium]
MKRLFLGVVPAVLLVVVAAGCGKSDGTAGTASPHPRPASSLDDAALGNGFYCSSDIVAEGPVHLASGSWSAEDAEGKQSLELGPPRARGDLDGDGREDAAVILLSSGGGSGVFVDLAVVLDRNGVPVHAASAPLGDRVQVHGVRIEGTDVLVDVTQQGPCDPACSPTQNTTRKFHFADGRLVDTAPPPKAPPGEGEAPAAGAAPAPGGPAQGTPAAGTTPPH